MVKETVNLQYASLQNLAFGNDFLFQKIHRKVSRIYRNIQCDTGCEVAAPSGATNSEILLSENKKQVDGKPLTCCQ